VPSQRYRNRYLLNLRSIVFQCGQHVHLFAAFSAIASGLLAEAVVSMPCPCVAVYAKLGAHELCAQVVGVVLLCAESCAFTQGFVVKRGVTWKIVHGFAFVYVLVATDTFATVALDACARLFGTATRET